MIQGMYKHLNSGAWIRLYKTTWYMCKESNPLTHSSGVHTAPIPGYGPTIEGTLKEYYSLVIPEEFL